MKTIVDSKFDVKVIENTKNLLDEDNGNMIFGLSLFQSTPWYVRFLYALRLIFTKGIKAEMPVGIDGQQVISDHLKKAKNLRARKTRAEQRKLAREEKEKQSLKAKEKEETNGDTK